jgi:hypothetical protein
MAAKSYITLLAGKLKYLAATVISTGVANDGDIVALDSTGKLDPSVLPVGVGPDVKVAEASENLGAGAYVNFWNDGGVTKVRLADNSNSRDAHGFVLDSFTTGQMATVYFEGPNTDLASLTPGSRYYLGAAGAVTATPPSAPSAQIHQFLGISVDTTTINTDIDDCIVL